MVYEKGNQHGNQRVMTANRRVLLPPGSGQTGLPFVKWSTGSRGLFSPFPGRLKTMPYVAFHELCPKVAERETRTIKVLPLSRWRVPPADYQFLEMFCDERGCDCRRVMFSVLSSATRSVVAVVAWGWEDAGFYARWFGMNDPATVKELMGPILNLDSPHPPYADGILTLTAEVLLADPSYVERIKRHYALFREKIDQAKGKRIRGQTVSSPAEPRSAGGTAKARRRRKRTRHSPGSGRTNIA
jgi:hypothetical protein